MGAYFAKVFGSVDNLKITTHSIYDQKTFTAWEVTFNYVKPVEEVAHEKVGAIRAWRDTNTDKKWLQLHPHQGWYEDYYHSSVQDLDRFFVRYLKGEEKGWEAAPKVRVSLYRYGDKYPVYDQVETDYPIPRTKYTKLFLTRDHKLADKPDTSDASPKVVGSGNLFFCEKADCILINPFK
ncbi:uncharacterized protein PV06_11180 [Exophiala oligosperma]|uniref:Uncharacterized protein n=1 Tax=Exophiala oligosperma TaxID=215243 RepID=A0A0D2D011_9EURO|nr:uncharacterized protein PV06_11180 [Exophiala oligosperma]KIW36593.1 hypothetical protein PV06_11180 [Exophiala oligosperma]